MGRTVTKTITTVSDKHVKNNLAKLSNSQLREITKRLKEQHELLMKSNERYKELYEALPDRSGFKSEVPLQADVVGGFAAEYRRYKSARRKNNLAGWKQFVRKVKKQQIEKLEKAAADELLKKNIKT